MKPKTPTHSQRAAFTLVEMLVVIAIIVILASILIPTILRARVKAKVAIAKTEMAELAGAIKTYHHDHSRWPVPKGYPANGFGDKTFGWIHNGTYFDNSSLMKILMAEPLPNQAVAQNKKGSYLTPKDSDDPELEGLPGLSKSRRYHDPFGNDYKVSLDFNGDGLCADVFYGRPVITKTAAIGLVERRPLKGGVGPDVYVLKGEVMIWSFGPDKAYSDGKNAVDGENNDNILSWR
jgi:prepilin-type N-terminal cleavage/methylation domain-containing protein